MISGYFAMRQLVHKGHIDALHLGVTQKSLWVSIEPRLLSNLMNHHVKLLMSWMHHLTASLLHDHPK